MARKIELEIIGDASSVTRMFKQTEKSARGFSVGLGTIAKSAALFRGITAAVGGVAAAVRVGAGEFSEASKVAAQTAAVLKSTGAAANVTAGHVDKLASQLSKLSGVDDEAVKSSENVLLTFTNLRNAAGVGNDIFDQATKTALDMSTALGTDLKSASIQVGKALNDPVKGVTALQRVGVSFTKAQKDQLKALVDSGKTMQAQKVILRELTKEFGGSARALGQTLPGQINIAKEGLKNLAGDLVGTVAPAFTRALQGVNEFGKRLSAAQGLKAKFEVAVEGVESIGRQVFDQIRESLRSTDFAKLVLIVQNQLVRGLRQIAKALDAVNWKAVGQSISRGLLTGIHGAAKFLQSVDWGIVGRQVVRGIVGFLKGVNWVALIKGVVKLVVAALRGVTQLLVGAGTELGKAILTGIGEGMKSLGRALEEQAIKIALRILHALDFKVFGHSLIPGIDGLVKNLEGRLDRLSKAATDTARTVEKAAGDVNRSVAVAARKTAKATTPTPRTATTGPGATGDVVTQTASKAAKAAHDVATTTARSLKTVSDTATAAVKRQTVVTKALSGALKGLPTGAERVPGVSGLVSGLVHDIRKGAASAADSVTPTRNAFNAPTFLDNLGLSPEQIRKLNGRLASLTVTGATLGPTTPTANAIAGAGGAVVVENHNTITLDGDVVGRSVTRSQNARKRRNPPQKRGPNAGI